MFPKLTSVPPTCSATTSRSPAANWITQCPVWSVPVWPRIRCQRASAWAASTGLPRISPSNSSTESQPSTSVGVVRAVAQPRRHRLGLQSGQRGRGLAGPETVHKGLVDSADERGGLQTRRAQQPKAGGAGRGQHEAWRRAHARGSAEARHRAGPTEVGRAESPHAGSGPGGGGPSAGRLGCGAGGARRPTGQQHADDRRQLLVGRLPTNDAQAVNATLRGSP